MSGVQLTWLDKFLQAWRRRRALRYVPPDARILDIGTHDGDLFVKAGATGVGIDPELVARPSPIEGVTLVRGYFPHDMPPQQAPFDVAAALAVVEHVPDEDLQDWVRVLGALIRRGGLVVITVPSPAVDRILHILMRLRLVGGMEVHQHHGFEPNDLLALFRAPEWSLVRRASFQLRLNNLFVFERN